MSFVLHTVHKLDHTDLNQTSMSRAQSTNLGMMYASIGLDARLTGKFFHCEVNTEIKWSIPLS